MAVTHNYHLAPAGGDVKTLALYSLSGHCNQGVVNAKAPGNCLNSFDLVNFQGIYRMCCAELFCGLKFFRLCINSNDWNSA